jgi:hypothetical protein
MTPQCMTALQKANDTRLARVELRRQVRAGELTLAAALDHPAAQGATIGKALTWQNRWGDTRARSFLVRQGIAESRRVFELTDRQRGLIVGRLS